MHKERARERVYWGQLVLATAGGLVFRLLPLHFWQELRFELCLIRQVFHHDCWGCGTLRALTYLAHGQVAAAWASNRLIFVWLVLLILAEIYYGGKIWRTRKVACRTS